ncbi:hypothetical protein ACP70R_020562 [Stipagrostis hirtigluma subsp. patula]
MKIGCDACGRAEATVLCCADEAALCRRCDAAVHTANKLAGRHHRVALLPSTAGPSPGVAGDDGSGSHPVCDVCQEKTGYFFCLDDRALLCRPCDVAVHAASAHASAHRRFLITGVRVGGTESSYVPGVDSATGVVVSPSSSGGNMMVGEEDSGQQQWPWSEVFADGLGVEQCYPGSFSEPGSSSLTG